MVDITEIVGNIVALVNSGNCDYFFGSKAEQNFYGDKGTFPAVLLDEPLQSDHVLNIDTGNRYGYTLSLFFCDKVANDATPQQLRTVINAQRNIAEEWVNQAAAYTYPSGTNAGRKVFNLTGDITYTILDVIDFPFDVHLSGVLLTITLPVYNYNGICI